MTNLTLDNLTPKPIEEGDAGIILKPDGSFQIFNTHKHIDGTNLTPEQLRQGRILLALATASAHPELLDVLLEVSNDPDVMLQINYGALN